MSRFHKLLRIDLTTRTYRSENISQKDEEMFLGGKGLGTVFLVRELAAGIDPLGPENKMIVARGTLDGHLSAGFLALRNRHEVSPDGLIS